MATKIDFNTWAGLMSGRITRVYADMTGNSPCLEYVRVGHLKTFVMTKRDAWGVNVRHELNADVTDEYRLNSHWQGFAALH